jgi:hypothetical protein
VAAVDGQQHREPGPFEAAGVQQPGEEPASLVDLADTEEGADADAGIAGPGEAVVPVADAAGVLGQRGGGRGDRCARRRVGQEPQREQAPDGHVAMGEGGVDVAAPPAPARLIGFEGGPGGVGVDVHERFVLGDGDRDRQRVTRRDGDVRPLSGLQPDSRRAAHGHGRRSPAAHERVTALLHAGRSTLFPEPGVEVDHRVDRSIFGSEPAHHEGGRQQRSGDLGDHRLGEREPAPVDQPGRLEAGGARPVAAADDGGRAARAQPERAGVGPADEAPEDGLAVETGDAHPIDGPVGGDQRGGAGVADQPVVLDGSIVVRGAIGSTGCVHGRGQPGVRSTPRAMP